MQVGFKVKVVSSWLGRHFKPFLNVLDALARLVPDLHNAGVPL